MAKRKSTALSLALSTGEKPLRDPRHERFAQLRSLLRPKADAYRQAGFDSKTDHAAAGNASRLEREHPEVMARIAYLGKQDEAVLAAKRRRLEEMLWLIHESNVADMWETVEVEKHDRKGNPVLVDGKPVMKKVQRPKFIEDMPEDVQRAVESISINEAGFVVPKPYSKLQANLELRKLLGIGVIGRDDGFERLSNEEIIAQLAAQSRELGIKIDLSYEFTSA